MVGAVLVFVAWVLFTPLPVKGDDGNAEDAWFACVYPVGSYDYTIVRLDLVFPENATDDRLPCRGAVYDEADMYNKRVDTGGHPKCEPQVTADYGIRYGCEWRNGVLTYLVIPMPDVIEGLKKWRARIELAREQAAHAKALHDDL
jgi:hypothetical protein